MTRLDNLDMGLVIQSRICTLATMLSMLSSSIFHHGWGQVVALYGVFNGRSIATSCLPQLPVTISESSGPPHRSAIRSANAMNVDRSFVGRPTLA